MRVLGDRLALAGLDAKEFSNRVQAEHPDSFLANLALANVLRTTAPAESMRYYQAALAIRPQSSTAHNKLGVTLGALGRFDEAIAEYEQALRLDGKSAQIPHNLGLALLQQQRFVEAEAALSKCLELLGDESTVRSQVVELLRQCRALQPATGNDRP
jgi:serine/threonine-protein kinase